MTSGPESGRIVNVTVESLGDVLAADALTGDSTIVVTDAADFDELEGGTLAAGGSQYAYTAVDNDTGVLTLAGALSADAFAGDRVDVWDAALGEPAVDMTAFVELPGYQANDDAIPASVRHSLVPLLAEGIREPGQGETVRLESDGDSYEVVDVRGKKPIVRPEFVGGGSYPNENTGFGDGALDVVFLAPGATQDTAFGFGALSGLTDGSANSAFGARALTLVGSGGSNTGVGCRAGQNVDDGDNNTLIGDLAGDTIVHGRNNTFIGTAVDASSDVTGAFAIGMDSTDTSAAVAADDEGVIGTAMHKVSIPGLFAVHGATPVAQSATPTTLPDVIAILQSHGFCA